MLQSIKEGITVDIPKEFQIPIFYLKNKDFILASRQCERFPTSDFENILAPEVETLIKDSSNELLVHLFDVLKWKIAIGNGCSSIA